MPPLTRGPAPRAAVLVVALALGACASGGLRVGALPSLGPTGAVERFGAGLLASDTAGDAVTFALSGEAEIALVAVADGGRVSALYPYAPGESSRFGAGSHTVSVPASAEWVPAPDARRAPRAALEMERARDYQRCLAARRPRRIGPAPSERPPADSASRRPNAAPAAPAPQELYGSDAEACGPPPVGGGDGLGSSGTFRRRNDVVVLVVADVPFTAATLRRRLAGLRVRTAAELRALPQRIAGEGATSWAGYYSRRY